jgi:hypothetical protein
MLLTLANVYECTRNIHIDTHTCAEATLSMLEQTFP